jgi:predicted metalloprotease with PDZ domain
MRAISTIWLMLVGTAFGQAPIRYHISFAGRDHHQASVAVTFAEIPSAELEVRMSRTSPGRYALHEFAKNVYDVKAVNGKGADLPTTRPNPHQWNVSGHDGTVKLTYTIFGDRCDGTYLAIDNTHAHMNIPATFMWARGLETRPIEITFEVPEASWKVATQLQATDLPSTYTAPNLAYFLDSPTEISDLTTHEWSIHTNGSTKAIQLAIHHSGTREEAAAYAELCKAVVAEAVAIFQELPISITAAIPLSPITFPMSAVTAWSTATLLF